MDINTILEAIQNFAASNLNFILEWVMLLVFFISLVIAIIVAAKRKMKLIDLEFDLESKEEELTEVKANHKERIKILKAEHSKALDVIKEETENSSSADFSALEEEYKAKLATAEANSKIAVIKLQDQINSKNTELTEKENRISELEAKIKELEARKPEVITKEVVKEVKVEVPGKQTKLPELSKMTKAELLETAMNMGIQTNAKMTKPDLIAVIKKAK